LTELGLVPSVKKVHSAAVTTYATASEEHFMGSSHVAVMWSPCCEDALHQQQNLGYVV